MFANRGGGWLPGYMGPKKGFGMMAMKGMPRGHLIIHELAMTATVTLESMGGSLKDYNEMLAGQLREVPSQAFKHNFFSLRKGSEEKLGKFGAYFDPNCVPCPRHRQKPARILGTGMARVNHSCAPNAQPTLVRAADDESEFWIGELRACRDISPGEEITVSYANMAMDIASRKEHMRIEYGFECACQYCETPVPSLEKHFLFVQENVFLLSQQWYKKYPAKCLKIAYEIFAGYSNHEIFDRRYCDHLVTCARICIYHSDIGRAMIFLNVAQAAFYLAEGLESKGMKYLLQVESDVTSPIWAGKSVRGLSRHNESEIIGKLDASGCIIAFMLYVKDDGYQRLCKIKKKKPESQEDGEGGFEQSLKTLPGPPPMLKEVRQDADGQNSGQNHKKKNEAKSQG